MTPDAAVALAPALPALAALLVALCGRWPNLREAVTIAAAAGLVATVASLVTPVLAGERPGVHLVSLMPGIDLALRVEPFGLLFALVASVLWLVSSVYSIGYMRANGEARQTRFFACFALALACTVAIAFAADLMTLFLFYEALTLVTYPLVTHHGDEQARAGGRTYLGVLLLTSTVLLLPAIVVTWFVAGTLEFVPGGVLEGKLPAPGATLLLALFLFGIGKAALMPFHRWLPAAMVAPAPVSALLHAVAVVKAGVFAVVKVIVYTFGAGAVAAAHEPFTWVAAFTIVAAAIVALRSDNLKRRLAYSTVSQLAYVVLASVLLAPVSIVGAALHMAAHAVSKITLFFAAGAVYTAAHKTEVSELDGVGRRMPWTFAAFGIAALSMIGLPPTIGLVSKWYIVSGALEVGNWVALGALAASTLLSAAYLLPVLHRGFLREGAPDDAHGEAPASMVAALLVTAAFTVLLFFFPGLPLSLAQALVR